jgi:thioredoxin-like negative regulator of GroEL
MQPATRFWIGIYSFTAVIMAIAVGVFVWVASESRKEAGVGRTANARPSITGRIPEERYELLARFVPPAYQPGTGVAESQEFKRAMEHYLKGDDAGALARLRAVAKAQPDSIEVRFYLGVCLLLTNDRSAGTQELRSVVVAGDTPYLERARFYLAKGLIGEHDIAQAERQLQSVIAMHGEFEKQAQVLLSQIVPGR